NGVPSALRAFEVGVPPRRSRLARARRPEACATQAHNLLFGVEEMPDPTPRPESPEVVKAARDSPGASTTFSDYSSAIDTATTSTPAPSSTPKRTLCVVPGTVGDASSLHGAPTCQRREARQGGGLGAPGR